MYEMLVGLEVTDDSIYDEYRKAMKPILINYEGGFSNDFKISQTLVSQTKNNINRVFTIYFKNKQSMESFFSNSEYKKAKDMYFSKSVKSTTIISEYKKS